MQLPPTDELVMVAGLAPIRAAKLRYYEDATFTARILPAPALGAGRYADAPPPRTNDWGRLARLPDARLARAEDRSEEHTSELQSIMRISYAVFCLQKKKSKVFRKTFT